jgi:TolB protein
MAADGTAQRNVSQRGGEAPSWSPHGTRIAFSWIQRAAVHQADGDITVIDADGSNLDRIVDGRAVASSPIWSPSGREIAHDVFNDFFRIVIVDSRGGRPLRFAPPLGRWLNCNRPAWSPNGRSIACEAGSYDRSEIFAFDADLEHAERLTHTPASERSPNWSPDGSHIVYVRSHEHRVSYQSDVAVMGKNGHDVALLTHTVRNEENPAFSPNGRWIVFERCCYGASDTSEIFVMRADGSSVRRITHNEVDDQDPDWQPIPRSS